MLNEHIVKDIAELHARLLDHHPVLQGHVSYFIKEFEEKRGDREKERLEKMSREINTMNKTLLPESLDAMQVYLANVSAKLKVATEVCHKIEEKGNNVETSILEEGRERRNKDWETYTNMQLNKCEQIDEDFEEQIKTLHRHYNELEDKLTNSSNLAAQ
ncbi:biogenesis of lysosome-related organelles complex 1 subunit 5-like [Mizuhopecten yessoensis]|uniref:Biogenesis of lysosome-related organelles complex 1 subunit 5 n=1 Tax=Mizuhopecten yessoensis TaxID=6573 RepID=A0A210PUL7_MIZYE|nr:biogenesis of lysosome-related organelles complex 1 subunit 5-like [Mizuhopecten yessoensis]OWF40144.1 Biogenesis of lysosome-related organelles complex 1 subunit 5 [Mizuhopecten yessoensis]